MLKKQTELESVDLRCSRYRSTTITGHIFMSLHSPYAPFFKKNLYDLDRDAM